MDKAPYAHNPAVVKKFFQTIQNLGKPPKVDLPYLPTIGFKVDSDRDLIRILRFLEFIDNDGVPTGRWNDYKNKDKATQVMALSIKSAYDELFNTFPDAEKRDSAAIENYFASRWGVSTQLAGLMEKTFRQLSELAEFEAVAVTEPVTKPSITTTKEAIETPPSVRPVTININIQLQLPATEDAAIYDSLFSALKKHFFS